MIVFTRTAEQCAQRPSLSCTALVGVHLPCGSGPCFFVFFLGHRAWKSWEVLSFNRQVLQKDQALYCTCAQVRMLPPFCGFYLSWGIKRVLIALINLVFFFFSYLRGWKCPLLPQNDSHFTCSDKWLAFEELCNPIIREEFANKNEGIKWAGQRHTCLPSSV